MSSAKEDTLSPDELRKRLYQTFKNKGVLDTLKIQLRNQLIRELRPAPLSGAEADLRPARPESERPLMASVCNNIVADYLRSSGYEYTLSVFYPESGLCKEEAFTKGDLVHLLRISSQSALYRSLSTENSDKGFLINLLTQLTHLGTPGLCHDADTQTSSTATCGESLVEKMKMIDKEYESIISSGDRWFSLQSKLDACRREIETQMQTEMKTKMQHFENVEIAKVKMEEKARFQKEFDKLKQELERTYEMKATALNQREKNAIDRLQKQQEIEEKNVYMQRQEVLKEIQTLRNRENELRLRMEAFEKTCQIHEEKVKSTEELLRRRELAVRTSEDTYDQKLKNELNRYRLELKEEYAKRNEKLTENETRNKVETARILKESADINAKLEEYSRACSEQRRLQVELDTAQQQISLLREQNELLKERLESMSEYPSLKREKTQLQGQVQLLRTQLEEAQEESRLLRADLSRPSKEQLALQMELQRLQSTRRLDEEEFDNQKQVLQAQLQSELEQCAQLKAQLREGEERSRTMTCHIEDLKMQLRQTQQALENEVLRFTKPSLVDRSVLDFCSGKLVPPDIYMDRGVPSTRMSYDDVREAGGRLRGHNPPWSDSPNANMGLAAEANARIQKLQEEVEISEEAYRRYQQRAARSTISHMHPPGSSSPHQAHPSHRPPSPLRKPVSHHLHSYSPHQTKISHTPLSSQMGRIPSSALHDTRTVLPPAQQRVTFSQDPNQLQSSGPFNDQKVHSSAEPLLTRDEHPREEQLPPFRCLPSTPLSPSRKKLQREIAEDEIVAPSFTDPPSDRRLPPVLDDKLSTSGSCSPMLSPPRSPQLKSTALDSPSVPEPHPVPSSSESSPQPEKINLEDLTGTSPEPGHIPELLLDTAVPLSEEAPDGPTVPRPQAPQDLPETPKDWHGEVEDPQVSGDLDLEIDKEDEEQRWERERKEKQEQRQREQEEARERELQELERLEKEMPRQEDAEEETGINEGAEEEAENDGKESKVSNENPLEKYMKILETRPEQHTQDPGRQDAGHSSPEAKSLSEEKDDGIAAYSLKDDADDDFW